MLKENKTVETHPVIARSPQGDVAISGEATKSSLQGAASPATSLRGLEESVAISGETTKSSSRAIEDGVAISGGRHVLSHEIATSPTPPRNDGGGLAAPRNDVVGLTHPRNDGGGLMPPFHDNFIQHQNLYIISAYSFTFLVLSFILVKTLIGRR